MEEKIDRRAFAEKIIKSSNELLQKSTHMSLTNIKIVDEEKGDIPAEELLKAILLSDNTNQNITHYLLYNISLLIENLRRDIEEHRKDEKK
nr:MAG TPA: hypothetical protein [Caudoviricetes sp.]